MNQNRMPNHLSYNNSNIELEASTGLVCLTDLWKAQCSPAKQRPLAWMRLEKTQKLLKRLAEQKGIEPIWSEFQRPSHPPQNLIASIPGILETTEDNGILRTWGTIELAVIYARFLAEDCYEWTLINLAEGNELWQTWAEQRAERERKRHQKVWTRRGVMAAGWIIPVVTSVALSQKAVAQVSPGHNDESHSDHGDSHGDTGGSHSDSHGDTGGSHSDIHSDIGASHGDSHLDTHGDGPLQHGDSHVDDVLQHSDSHVDDVLQHLDSHLDEVLEHSDSHIDTT